MWIDCFVTDRRTWIFFSSPLRRLRSRESTASCLAALNQAGSSFLGSACFGSFSALFCSCDSPKAKCETEKWVWVLFGLFPENEEPLINFSGKKTEFLSSCRWKMARKLFGFTFRSSCLSCLSSWCFWSASWSRSHVRAPQIRLNDFPCCSWGVRIPFLSWL